MSILEVVNVSRDVAWLPWAVQYFFLVGISVACFAMSLPGYILRSYPQKRESSATVAGSTEPGPRFRGDERTKGGWANPVLARLALVGALSCGLVAPVALLADLHQPGRFWRFYAHPNLSSWMAWGACFIPGYVAGLIAYAWAALRPDFAMAGRGGGAVAALYRRLACGAAPSPWLVRAVAGWTAVFAALILVYTGMEVMVIRARPLWNTPFLPLQFVATSFTGAAGLVLVLQAVLRETDREAERAAGRWLAKSLVVTVLLGVFWFLHGALALDRTHVEALASVSGHAQWRLTALWAGAATLVPLAILWMRPTGLGWLVGLLALHAAWMFRWTVFIGGQTVPKTGAGLYVYRLPLGHDGLLGIAGTLGLWLFIVIALVTLLPSAAPSSGARRTFEPAE